MKIGLTRQTLGNWTFVVNWSDGDWRHGSVIDVSHPNKTVARVKAFREAIKRRNGYTVAPKLRYGPLQGRAVSGVRQY